MFLLMMFFKFNHAVFFLNRYLIPKIENESIIPRYRTCDMISIVPFYLSASKAHFAHNILSSIDAHDVYELEGVFSCAALDNALLEGKIINTPTLSSYWVTQGVKFPIGLGGRISGAGLAFNITKNIFDSFVLGCSGGVANITGALHLKINPENDYIQLNEGILYQIFNTYRDLTKANNMHSLYDKHFNFTNIDLFLRYEILLNFFCGCRSVKITTQAGCILPTDGERDIDNAAGFSLGTDNRFGGYGKIGLDILLKEDLSFGAYCMGLQLENKTTTIRTEIATESQRFGAWRGVAEIMSGLTWMFGANILLEGIRNGLGFKLAYDGAYHTSDSWNFIDQEPLFWNKTRSELLSIWGQEHVTIGAFYDFMRMSEYYDYEPMMGIEFKLPVDWFCSKQSTKCYAIVFTAEILY